MKLSVLTRKKTYTRCAALLSLFGFIFSLIGLVHFGWFEVADAPKQKDVHQLLRYGLFGACFSSNYGTDEEPRIEERCHSIAEGDCRIFISAEGQLLQTDVALGAASSCRQWNAASAMYLNSIVFFMFSTVLASFAAFAISPPLLLGVATSLFVATVSMLTAWAILNSSRSFTIVAKENFDEFEREVYGSANWPFVLVTMAWVMGLVSFGIETWAALKDRSKGYRTAAMYYDDDNPDVDMAHRAADLSGGVDDFRHPTNAHLN